MAEKAAPLVDFMIGTKYSTRQSFTTPTTTLGAQQVTASPIEIPAVGYLDGILMEVNIALTGGTTPTFTADGPFNAIANFSLRNAGGTQYINGINGFELYVINKYGGQIPGLGLFADPKVGEPYTATATGATFMLWVPIGLDRSEALGVLPALNSAAEYQIELAYAPISAFVTGNPTASISIRTTAFYYDLPVNTGAMQFHSEPPGLATVSLWQKENTVVTPGMQLIKTNNVGNIIRNQIFILRNSAGARIEGTDWPEFFELYQDNNPRFTFSRNVFRYLMRTWYGLNQPIGSPGGRDTGVFAIPYHTIVGNVSGDSANTRAQLMSTLTASLIQFKASDFGPNASNLQVLTNAVTTNSPDVVYEK